MAAASAEVAEEAAGPGGARGARLPLARVKALVKADPDVSLASHEAVVVLARAAELFVETIAKDAYVYAQQGKRKTLQRKDLDNAIEAIDEFAFLEGKVLQPSDHLCSLLWTCSNSSGGLEGACVFGDTAAHRLWWSPYPREADIV